MKIPIWVLLPFLLVSTGFPQQVGKVDLTQLVPTKSATGKKPASPSADCKQPEGGMAYGAMLPDDKQPRPISLEIVKLSTEHMKVGSEVRADIRLRNTGTNAISIPLGLDSSVIEKGTDSNHLQWEQANFEFTLRDKQNRRIPTTGAEISLYGTKTSQGSLATLNPGEWVTAIVNFRLEDVYHITKPAEFPLGDATLFVRWQQESRYWTSSEMWMEFGLVRLQGLLSAGTSRGAGSSQ